MTLQSSKITDTIKNLSQTTISFTNNFSKNLTLKKSPISTATTMNSKNFWSLMVSGYYTISKNLVLEKGIPPFPKVKITVFLQRLHFHETHRLNKTDSKILMISTFGWMWKTPGKMPGESSRKKHSFYFSKTVNKSSSKVVLSWLFLKILNLKKEVNLKLSLKLLANRLESTILRWKLKTWIM